MEATLSIHVSQKERTREREKGDSMAKMNIRAALFFSLTLANLTLTTKARMGPSIIVIEGGTVSVRRSETPQMESAQMSNTKKVTMHYKYVSSGRPFFFTRCFHIHPNP